MIHSNVFYALEYNAKDKSKTFKPQQKARTFKNSYNLDLFVCGDKISEGKTGLKVCDKMNIDLFEKFIESHGGVEKINEIINRQLSNNGFSPRYTRPDEKKSDLFPEPEKDENTIDEKGILALNGYGEKHRYIKFDSKRNEKVREFYILRSAKNEFNATVFVLCNGIMIGVDQLHRINCVHSFLDNINDDMISYIQQKYDEAILNEYTWIDMSYAMILNKVDEAKQHNEVIRQMRKAENDKQDSERKAKQEQQEKEKQEAIKKQIVEAEQTIKNQEQIINEVVKGTATSIILFLMKKYNVQVPLKTQGWINNALYSLKKIDDEYSYQYYKRSSDSTVFRKYLAMLVEKIQAA